MSSHEFTLENADDQVNQKVHLTNNAIQKKDANYGKVEDGNQLSYASAA